MFSAKVVPLFSILTATYSWELMLHPDPGAMIWLTAMSSPLTAVNSTAPMLTGRVRGLSLMSSATIAVKSKPLAARASFWGCRSEVEMKPASTVTDCRSSPDKARHAARSAASLLLHRPRFVPAEYRLLWLLTVMAAGALTRRA